MARPREVTDVDILAAAREVFIEHGPGASTNLVAEKLGVSSATLFHRFGSKRELMIASLVPTPPPLDACVYDPEVGLREQLQVIARLLRAFPGNDAGVGVLRAAGICPQEIFARFPEPPPVTLVRGLTAFFADARKAGVVVDQEPEHLALSFLGSLKITHFFKYFCETDVPADEDAYMDSVVELLSRGLR